MKRHVMLIESGHNSEQRNAVMAEKSQQADKCLY
jgi:hypothetical protein